MGRREIRSYGRCNGMGQTDGLSRYGGSMFYDHRTMAGRWGRLLCRILMLKVSGDRYLDDIRSTIPPSSTSPRRHRP